MRLAASVFGFALLGLALVLLAPPARAGGGPETILVVVNAESPSSLQVANAYVRLRDVPANHVLYLEDVPAEPVVTIDAFRDRILRPIEAYLESEGLKDDVDTIAYSTGFPYGVDFTPETLAKGFKPPQSVTRIASLTGLTFFYRSVLARAPERYLDLQGNGYFRRPSGAKDAQPRQASGAEKRHIADAQGAMRSKDYRRAIEALKKLTQLAPSEAGYWYALARCLAITKQREAALDALEHAVEHGFTDADGAAGEADLENIRSLPAFQKLLDAMGTRGAGVQSARGFSAQAAWTGADDPTENPAADAKGRYRLAVMLGWTGRYGNSVDEVLRCLEQAAASDGSHPQGTVYMLVNADDARSGPRRRFFPGTVDALKRMGRKGEVLETGKDGQDGVLPRAKDDVMGIVAGIPRFRWGKGDPELLPGAIAENLTSFGAHFGTPGQTKCTEFIRHGAAGTCGAVSEPRNPWSKFPVPYLHVHYAHGCSLGEAFYQSIFGPYQQLILGDPLARPFARFGEVRLAAPDASAPWSGTIDIRFDASAPPGHTVRAVELWVDGKKLSEATPGEALRWDTTTVADGAHEVRLVAIDADPIRTRWYTKEIVHIANGTGSLEVKPPSGPVACGEVLKLKGKAAGIEGIEAVLGTAVIATTEVTGKTWQLEVDTALLGEGRVELSLRGARAGGGYVFAPPLPVEIGPVAGLRMPEVVDESTVLPGLRATFTDGDGGRHEGVLITLNDGPGRQVRHDLADLGVEKPVRVELEGMLHAPSTGLWELEIHARSALSVFFGEEEVVRLEEAPTSGRAFVRVGLTEGWHEFALVAEGPDAGALGVLLGGPRAQIPLADRAFGWLPESWRKASAPEAILKVPGEDPRAAFDGNRGGRGVPVRGDGLGVQWKRSERSLAGVVLWPFRSQGASPLTKAWIVETRSSERGRWKAAKDARVIVCPGPEQPKKDRVVGPRYLIIQFAKTTGRQLRVRPADTEGTKPPVLTELEIRVLSRRSR